MTWSRAVDSKSKSRRLIDEHDEEKLDLKMRGKEKIEGSKIRKKKKSIKHGWVHLWGEHRVSLLLLCFHVWL